MIKFQKIVILKRVFVNQQEWGKRIDRLGA